MTTPATAVFDFDGTIVSKDTGYEFYKWLTLQSVPRTALMSLAAPLVIPLLLSCRSRKFGLNIACVIATFAQSQSLFRLRQQFIRHYFDPDGVAAVAYPAALSCLRAHQQAGDKVIIISGCPRWLLTAVVKHLGIINVKVIASEQRIKYASLLIDEHCFAANKIPMAQAVGEGPDDWRVGYSDSRADLPFLNRCQQARLINVHVKTQANFSRRLAVPSQFLSWHKF